MRRRIWGNRAHSCGGAEGRAVYPSPPTRCPHCGTSSALSGYLGETREILDSAASSSGVIARCPHCDEFVQVVLSLEVAEAREHRCPQCGSHRKPSELLELDSELEPTSEARCPDCGAVLSVAFSIDVAPAWSPAASSLEHLFFGVFEGDLSYSADGAA